MNKIKIITIEYETKDRTNWKAGVLAYSIEEAVKTIMNSVRNFDRIISTSYTRDVDIISKEVYDELSKMVLNSKPVKNDDKLTEDNIKSNVKTNTSNKKPVNNPPTPKSDILSCPFCNKEYKTQKTLVNHINKYHGK